MKKALLGLMLLVASPVFAMDLGGDLSGAYRISGSKNDQSFQNDIVVVKTDLKYFGSPYYTVTGNVGKDNIIGLSIGTNQRGIFIQWLRLASASDGVEGTRLDGEINLILDNRGDILSLGGDNLSSPQVWAKMEKNRWLSK